MKPNWPVKTRHINGCRLSAGHCAGDVEVEVEGYDRLGNPYLFRGTGEDTEAAIEDGNEHGWDYFETLDGGGQLGDWWLKGQAPKLEDDYWQDMARDVRNGRRLVQ